MTDYSYAFYNPHNARFYFDFQKWNFKPDMTLFRTINSTELTIEFMDCRLVVKKTLIEITNKINSERKFTVWLESEDKDKIVEKANQILLDECINVLKQFIVKFGGASNFSFKKFIPDNKILHDLIIDQLPKDMRFRNDVVKKEYNTDPSNVEFSNPVYASNYFRNAGLRLFSPDIVDRLDSIASERLAFNGALKVYTEQINLHLKVEERQLMVQDKTLEALNLLSQNLSKSPPTVDVVDSGIVPSGLSPLSTRDNITKFDVVNRTKKYRLFKARMYLSEYGWGSVRW